MIDLQLFPKSKKLLQEFAKKNLLAFQKNIMKENKVEGVEIPEITDDMAENYATALLSTNPRILYDFFDEQEIYLSIRNARKDNFYFSWNVKFDKGVYKDCSKAAGKSSISSFKTRLECEDDAYKFIFKLLEEKL